MEIKELVSYYINETSHTLDVTFKTLTDSEDEIRTDQIVLDEIETFGYNILNNINDDFFEDDDEEFEDMFDDFEEEELDEDEMQWPDGPYGPNTNITLHLTRVGP